MLAWLFACLFAFFGRLIDRIGWYGLLVGWLVGRSDGLLVDWLVFWLVIWPGGGGLENKKGRGARRLD